MPLGEVHGVLVPQSLSMRKSFIDSSIPATETVVLCKQAESSLKSRRYGIMQNGDYSDDEMDV